jgi:hypothetical protein
MSPVPAEESSGGGSELVPVSGALNEVLRGLLGATEAVGDLAVLQAGVLELEGEILPGPRPLDELVTGFGDSALNRAWVASH